ncbi:MAG: phytoene desaturase [Saprospiraceae bacterium]|nr:phytoene desaturase [Saprospiraceae bacterium]
MKTVGVIGSGFSGLAAASSLAASGFKVTVLEKNETLGGRARKFESDGYIFDMGPSWYWMPEVFENFFNKFGKKTSDYYKLIRLDPSYDVIFGADDIVSMPADYKELKALFDNIEPGSSQNLDKFLHEAEYKYKVGMEEFVWKPGQSIMEFVDIRVVKSLFRLQMLTSIATQIDKLFKNEKLRNILKFPVLFLGATPENTPALYSLMNYADLRLGTWYPMGGMYKVIEGFVSVAKELGVDFITNAEVTKLNVTDGKVTDVQTEKGSYSFDFVVASADYHHVEQSLLPEQYRTYDKKYWESRTMAPSSLLFYLGLNTRLKGLKHHNLFFDKDFALHAKEIYTDPKWPTDPLFYVSCPTMTDDFIAPRGCENVFLLMPLAPGVRDNEVLRAQYFDIICDRIKFITGNEIRDHIVFKKSYCVSDFESDYHAFKGNAYGLANTLYQTAFLKPKMHNKNISNLYYTGQLTTPGPGVPPSIISGQVVANEIIKLNKS